MTTYKAVFRNQNGECEEIGRDTTIKGAIADAYQTIKNEGLEIKEFWIHEVWNPIAVRHIEVV